MLGLKRGTVKLNKYNPKWPRLFKQEKRLLQKTLGNKIIAIEHIGSTAIPGLPAKPLIDINVAVASFNDTTIKKFITPLQSLGYNYMHKFPGRRFFAKGPESKRTHHLSLVKFNSQTGWHDHLLFRDYLRSHKIARDKYATLKLKLAKQFPTDRASYTKGKENFIRQIIHQARKIK